MATVIRTATELQAMSANLDGDYELGGNISASETAAWNAGAGFIPIGDNATPFTGTFDGKGYTITGLTINRPLTDYIGLFGYTAGTAEAHVVIKNVTLASAAITGDDSVGALVGYALAYTNLSDCHSSGAVTGDNEVGGLVGDAYDADPTLVTLDGCTSSCTVTASGTDGGGLVGVYTATLTDCYATGAVTAKNYASGLGDSVGGVTKRCFATGAVTATNNYAGGLCGYLSGPIEDCYATGAATGDASADGSSTGIGGFVGQVETGTTVKRCYSTGAVSGTTVVGGFIGDDGGATFTACAWDTTTSGTATACGSGAVTGVTGYETAAMKLLATFAALLWGIGTVWNLSAACNSGYPCLIGVNPCCPMGAAGVGDVTVTKTKPSLELIRNVEMQCGGLSYVAKNGNFTYESRYARHG